VTVHLVGAGPGDPGLITVRGAELLRRADVVVHDRLADVHLLDLAPPAALRIDVGKAPGGPVQQDAINELLVEHGRTAACVVRLKGGDPFVFGRGGEEAQALLAAGVEFTVVPGVTAAVAAAAYAGIPLTHRGLSTSFTLVTGHSRHGVDHDIDWEHLARAGDTIVVYMGVAHRAEIARRLIEGGRPAATPVAAIRWGTRPDQATIRTTLDGLGAAPLEPPCAIVIGEVAVLDLAWFERRPLFGRTVAVTRATTQASTLVAALEDAGAQVVELPTIAIEPAVAAGAELGAALTDPPDWIVVSSVNGADVLFGAVPDARALAGARVAAVGGATADALLAHGVRADLVPERANAGALVEAFPEGSGRVVVVQADIARPTLRDGLRAKGWDVLAVDGYRTVPVTPDPVLVARAASADAVCFTSGSTVDGWVRAHGGPHAPAVVATIGPVTTAACVGCGIAVSVEAAEATIPSLVAAVVQGMAPRRDG
jgi:uroporphyrinogen III methyltransferase/synthase